MGLNGQKHGKTGNAQRPKAATCAHHPRFTNHHTNPTIGAQYTTNIKFKISHASGKTGSVRNHSDRPDPFRNGLRKGLKKAVQGLFQTIGKWHKHHPDRQSRPRRTFTDRLPPLPDMGGNTDFTFPDKRDIDKEVNEFHNNYLLQI